MRKSKELEIAVDTKLDDYDEWISQVDHEPRIL